MVFCPISGLGMSSSLNSSRSIDGKRCSRKIESRRSFRTPAGRIQCTWRPYSGKSRRHCQMNLLRPGERTVPVVLPGLAGISFPQSHYTGSCGKNIFKLLHRNWNRFAIQGVGLLKLQQTYTLQEVPLGCDEVDWTLYESIITIA